MSKDDLLFAMARAIVRSNQAEWDKLAEDWSRDELEANGFYAAAFEVHRAILDSGFVIYPRRPPQSETVDAVADAIRKTFSPYKRITPGDAAIEFLVNLAATRHQVKRIGALPQ